ncbi:MAG: hypothetical protein HQM13_17925 [SAR324 cluster bacterium]|nr:hypothetical protein [SAR324 cluster bacterium]
MSEEEKKEEEGQKEEVSLDSLPPHIEDRLEELYHEAMENRGLVQTVLSIQKAADFIERTKLALTKKKEKSDFGKLIGQLCHQISQLKELTTHLEAVKKRNGELVVIRRFMDLVVHKTNKTGTTMRQAESLLGFSLLFCVVDNPHVKSIQASYHLTQIFIARRIDEFAGLGEIHKKMLAKNNASEASMRKQLKQWLSDEEQLIKIVKDLSTPIKLGGAGDLLMEEFSDDDRTLLKNHMHVAESQCPSKVKNVRKKFYLIFGNMTSIVSLIEHARNYSLSLLGGKENLQSLQDLSILCCIARTYVQELSRLQQLLLISPQAAQKRILALVNEASPFIFTGFKKISDFPKVYFELVLLENIGYYLTFYVLLVGGIFKNPQIKSPQIQHLIKGTIDKLTSEKANSKIRDMLQNQFNNTMNEL